VMSLNDALRLAQAKGLDLVEIAATATPPVCRIVNYGKFLYDEAKRNKDARAPQSASRMKEISSQRRLIRTTWRPSGTMPSSFFVAIIKCGSSCGSRGGRKRTRR